MTVTVALGIINDVLGGLLDGEEAELETDSRFALAWFTQRGYDPGPSGDDDSVVRAKNTSLAAIQRVPRHSTHKREEPVYQCAGQ